MIDAFAAFKLYSTLKAHFTTSYDYFRYDGKMARLNTVGAQQKFLANKQRYFFAQLGRHADPTNLVVSNLLKEPKMYIVEIISDAGYSNHTEMMKRWGRVSYNFQNDISDFTSPQDLTAISNSGAPVLLEKYIAGQLSAETLVIVDAFAKTFDRWTELPNPLVKREISKLQNYRGFVVFPHDKCKQILLETLNTRITS